MGSRNVGQESAFSLDRMGKPAASRSFDLAVEVPGHRVVVAVCAGDTCKTIAQAIEIALSARLRSELPAHPRAFKICTCGHTEEEHETDEPGVFGGCRYFDFGGRCYCDVMLQR